MEFIIGENQGSFLLSETIFWQESVAECKLSNAKKRKAEWRSTFELGLHSKLYIPKMEHNFSLVFSSSIPNAYLYDIT